MIHIIQSDMLFTSNYNFFVLSNFAPDSLHVRQSGFVIYVLYFMCVFNSVYGLFIFSLWPLCFAISRSYSKVVSDEGATARLLLMKAINLSFLPENNDKVSEHSVEVLGLHIVHEAMVLSTLYFCVRPVLQLLLLINLSGVKGRLKINRDCCCPLSVCLGSWEILTDVSSTF